MFGSILHGHNVARAIRLRHMRQGRELEPVNVNEAFDFDYQQLTLLGEERAVLPGDTLIAQCTYDTSAAEKVSYGGQSSSEEMCINYVYYYPRKPAFSHCFSSHVPQQLEGWFEVAQAKGYYDAEADTYDVQADGALDHYMDLVDGEEYERLIYCQGVSETVDMPRDFEQYQDPDEYGCGAAEHASGAEWQWDAWYVWVAAACLVCAVGLAIVCCRSKRAKTGAAANTASSYQMVSPDKEPRATSPLCSKE